MQETLAQSKLETEELRHAAHHWRRTETSRRRNWLCCVASMRSSGTKCDLEGVAAKLEASRRAVQETEQAWTIRERSTEISS